ncbi:dTDP-4-dehydrorhamnose 3,5-epimerase [Acetivibrio cellulolyticus]|uniref:dTDP-4-dehydrorhamnose 3,5-epimerase n=1 Tax=Acetivibrio cellulolyticus TaxID=35830 RepID=UPI0001E2CBEA|nr:dTDP-4-dehydrorhamnose 3,5-epimerase [Acetivibrio cellulolyticus]
MNNFSIKQTGIRDLVIIESKVFGDSRGFFMESYNKASFEELGLNMEFVQDNHSKSKKGVLRGIHFQTKYAQGKLVRVIKGRVYDVAVDLRKGSETFGKWYAIELTEENKTMFYIPEGFGHAFLTMEDDTEFSYKTTNIYHPEYDAGIIYKDKDIAIDWPNIGCEFILSEKDKVLPSLKETGL